MFSIQEWHQTALTHSFGRPPGLFLSDLFNGALDLGHVDSLVVDLNDAANNCSHFSELVPIACYEVELGQSHDGCIDEINSQSRVRSGHLK